MPTRSERKRRAILEAATDLFLEKGYGATSMSAVAREAEVSKPTVYNHFDSKEGLFGAVVEQFWGKLVEPETPEVSADAEPAQVLSTSLAAALDHLSRPDVLALLQTVVAESTRFPEMAQAFYERGKKPAFERLSNYIARLDDEGVLTADDPRLAAQQLLGMVKESLFWPQLFGVEVPETAEERKAVIDEAVRRFLEAH